jgi:hypothetical protein
MLTREGGLGSPKLYTFFNSYKLEIINVGVGGQEKAKILST